VEPPGPEFAVSIIGVGQTQSMQRRFLQEDAAAKARRISGRQQQDLLPARYGRGRARSRFLRHAKNHG